MQTFKLDTEKGRIEFLDSRFYLSPNGSYVPSVTTILEAFPKSAQFYQWLKEMGGDADTIRDEAGRRGSVVHQLTERYDSGEEVSFLNEYGKPAYKLLEWAMFERYIDFVNVHHPEVQMMEVHMIDDVLGYAGTIDRVIELNGKTVLMDIKTSNAVHDSYWLQLAAYHELLKCNGRFVDQVGILWLNAKTRTTGRGGAIQGVGWQLILKDAKEIAKDLQLFESTFVLWKALNEDIKPRNLSYTIKYQK